MRLPPPSPSSPRSPHLLSLAPSPLACSPARLLPLACNASIRAALASSPSLSCRRCRSRRVVPLASGPLTISPPNPTPTCPSPSGWRCSSPSVCRHRRRQRRRRRRLVGAGPGRTGAGHGPPPVGPGPPAVLYEYPGLQTELVPERLTQAARLQSWFQRQHPKITFSLTIHCTFIV